MHPGVTWGAFKSHAQGPQCRPDMGVLESPQKVLMGGQDREHCCRGWLFVMTPPFCSHYSQSVCRASEHRGDQRQHPPPPRESLSPGFQTQAGEGGRRGQEWVKCAGEAAQACLVAPTPQLQPGWAWEDGAQGCVSFAGQRQSLWVSGCLFPRTARWPPGSHALRWR